MRPRQALGTVERVTDRRPLAERLRRVDGRVLDALLTLALTALGVGSQFSTFTDDEGFRDTDPLAIALGLAVCLPVYWRRRYPLASVLVSTTAITIIGVAEYRTNNLPLVVLFIVYAVGAHAQRGRDLAGLLAVAAGIVIITASGVPDLDEAGALLQLVLFGGVWLAGQVVRSRAATAEAKVAEAEERAEAQRQLAARSVAEERLRLAQELHDVVAHSMSVIAVQAGMGAHVIDERPADAKRALQTISDTSRTTLQEMRRLLGVLRDEDGIRSHAPAPGIDDLSTLVDDVRGAGVPVQLDVEGDPAAVPHGIELSVYRLVQEGLTNVIKHAGPASASVRVRCVDGAVEVDVVDDGRGAAAVAARNGDGGHGLVGMRERVALWGGTIDVGPRPGGGFAVRARLPYGEPS